MQKIDINFPSMEIVTNGSITWVLQRYENNIGQEATKAKN